jgi:hypothetical protein
VAIVLHALPQNAAMAKRIIAMRPLIPGFILIMSPPDS